MEPADGLFNTRSLPAWILENQKQEPVAFQRELRPSSNLEFWSRVVCVGISAVGFPRFGETKRLIGAPADLRHKFKIAARDLFPLVEATLF